jgi:CheY-like chemotaxis protein
MNRDLSSAKILIVDDVVQNIQVLGSTLSKVGYDVFYCPVWGGSPGGH